MSREQNIDPPQPGDEPELPPPPRDPIEPDPMNPKSAPLPDAEPEPGELPKEDWEWTEHED